MTPQTKTVLGSRLAQQKLLFDGAFGTYYAQLFDAKELPELANTLHPERVRQIHAEYIEAGAQIIRTNTFAANTFSLDLPWETIQDNLRQGYRLAKEAARGKDVCVPGLGVKLQVLGTKLLPHKTVMNIWMRQQKH